MNDKFVVNSCLHRQSTPHKKTYSDLNFMTLYNVGILRCTVSIDIIYKKLLPVW